MLTRTAASAADDIVVSDEGLANPERAAVPVLLAGGGLLVGVASGRERRKRTVVQ